MANTVTELMMRRMMGAKSGGIDWATIGHGMLDCITPFSVTAEALAVFPNVITKTYLFIGRTNLKSIDFTGQIYIPERICQGVGISTLTLPDTITRIGNYAFYGCVSLIEVISEKSTPPTLGTGALQGCTSLTSIYVPDASVSTYQGTSQWSTYASIIKPISQRPT